MKSNSSDKRCPITYQAIGADQRYSSAGLHLLSPKLNDLLPLPLSAAELRQEARNRADKMSIQGVQAKLSAIIDVKDNSFKIVDRNGTYILKPPSDLYPDMIMLFNIC
jgi:serine/threonine-protein kinase HipA